MEGEKESMAKRVSKIRRVVVKRSSGERERESKDHELIAVRRRARVCGEGGEFGLEGRQVEGWVWVYNRESISAYLGGDIILEVAVKEGVDGL